MWVCQMDKCPLHLDFGLILPYIVKVVKGTHMTHILNDTEQLKLINNFAEHLELTVDYVIEEFVVDGEFIAHTGEELNDLIN